MQAFCLQVSSMDYLPTLPQGMAPLSPPSLASDSLLPNSPLSQTDLTLTQSQVRIGPVVWCFDIVSDEVRSSDGFVKWLLQYF